MEPNPDEQSVPPVRPSGVLAGRVGAVAAIAAGTALIAAHGFVYGHWIMDDAAITFGYARNVADGYGPVLQPGLDPVEGYSNPVWMALLALGALVGLFDHGTIFGVPDYVLFPKALGIACCAGILTLFYFAAKVLTRRPRLATLLAGAALAAMPSFVIWIVSGLENPVYALFVTAVATVLVRAIAADRLLNWRTGVLAGVFAAGAALSRPDGAIYAGAFGIVALLFLRRDRIKQTFVACAISVGAFAVPFGAYLAYRWFTFHRLVPNTAVAKDQPLPALEDLGKPSLLVGYVGWAAALLVVGLVAATLARRTPTRAQLAGLLVPLGLAVAAFCVLQADWMGEYRFATPIWTLGALIAGVSLTVVWDASRLRARALLALGLVAAAALASVQFEASARSWRMAAKTPLCIVVERDARTMNGIADILGRDGLSAGVIDLGGQSMASDLRLIDLAGLGDAKMAEYLGDADLQGLRDYTFTEAKPSIITFIGTWDTTLGFTTDARFDQDYYLVYQSAPPWPGILLSYNRVGFWVRKELVADQAQLARLRTYTHDRVEPVLRENAVANRRDCGPVLRPGQTE
ncbi:dolichyl-phosphate-mannose-protein mannosyltransferase [Actinokineospora cianjurensis]|uniref:Dolichyl-phosphate-mannose-protein mannosyltransferase n=1 Tax=Actinokineospora cianjurensis TaxID=585224 RepID=A0A421B766_9PSEU|nr:dolichyl-phosphate-mannose-protein mannosyltransferase [Actinokineospora cianjurensis]